MHKVIDPQRPRTIIVDRFAEVAISRRPYGISYFPQSAQQQLPSPSYRKHPAWEEMASSQCHERYTTVEGPLLGAPHTLVPHSLQTSSYSRPERDGLATGFPAFADTRCDGKWRRQMEIYNGKRLSCSVQFSPENEDIIVEKQRVAYYLSC